MEALPTFREAFKVWAYIGCVNFGGPAGQIALMHRLLVEERKWISEERYFHALNYCMLLPGPEAQQLATYVGWLMHGVRGGLAAGIMFILPGALVMLGLSLLYVEYAHVEVVADIFYGIKAAVLAIVIEAVVRISKRAFTGPAMHWIAGGAFVALFFLAVPFPIVVLVAALTGFFGARFAPGQFHASGHKAGTSNAAVVYAIDAAFERGALKHTQTTRGQTAATVAIWLAVWLTPMGVLAIAFGPSDLFTTMAVFFSKMSVVTFGGAYAVLAYVAQEAVATYHWMTAPEMLDGLALAETTPGPLILVLQHVGFLAAYRNAGLDPVLSGLFGALITLWVTFVPSFLWIFAGAPYAERVRQNRELSGALAAITAAVVGVIMNLAVWFALHVLFANVTIVSVWPLQLHVPDFSTLNGAALALSLAAATGLLWFRLPIAILLVVCATAGLLVRLLDL